MDRPPRLGVQAVSDLASRSEAALRARTRAHRAAQDGRGDKQALLDLEATEETVPARRLRWPDPTDDKINEAFKRATSC
jgi:hypothetical protein